MRGMLPSSPTRFIIIISLIRYATPRYADTAIIDHDATGGFHASPLLPALMARLLSVSPAITAIIAGEHTREPPLFAASPLFF